MYGVSRSPFSRLIWKDRCLHCLAIRKNAALDMGCMFVYLGHGCMFLCVLCASDMGVYIFVCFVCLGHECACSCASDMSACFVCFVCLGHGCACLCVICVPWTLACMFLCAHHPTPFMHAPECGRAGLVVTLTRLNVLPRCFPHTIVYCLHCQPP